MKRWLALPFLAAVGFACLAPVTNEPVTEAPPEAPPARSSIGPAGGFLFDSANGVRLDVPPGALDHDEHVTMTPMFEPLPPKLGMRVGPSFRLGPSGLTFAKPLTVTFQGLTWQAARAFLASDDLSQSELLPLKRNAKGELQADIPHFSVMGAVSPPETDAGTPGPDAGVADAGAPPPCGGGTACPSGCLGDAPNCGACGTTCSDGCVDGRCAPSLATRTLLTQGKLTQVAVTPDGHVLAAAQGLWLSAPGTSSFTAIRPTTEWFGAVYADDTGLVVAAGRDLVRSTDWGATWTTHGAIGCTSLVPGANGELWCAYTLARSRDGGKSFQAVATGQANELVRGLYVAPTGEVFATVENIKGGFNQPPPRAALVSTDGGASWVRQAMTQPCLGLFGTSADAVYAACEGGLYRVGRDAGFAPVTSLAAKSLLDGWTDGTLFVVTGSRGMFYVSRDGAKTWTSEATAVSPMDVAANAKGTVVIGDVAGSLLFLK